MDTKETKTRDTAVNYYRNLYSSKKERPEPIQRNTITNVGSEELTQETR